MAKGGNSEKNKQESTQMSRVGVCLGGGSAAAVISRRPITTAFSNRINATLDFFNHQLGRIINQNGLENGLMH